MNTTESRPSAASASTRWRAAYWVHLIWLAMVFFQPVFDPEAGAADWLLAGALVAIVVPLYALAQLRPEHTRAWFTVPMVVIALAATPFNMGASVLFVYAAAGAAAVESHRDTLRWLVGLTALWSVFGGVLIAFSRVELPWALWSFIPPLLFIWLVGLWLTEHADQERAASELRIQNARTGHLATMAERERIARDLHDLLGHSLTSVVVRAQLVQRLIERDPARAGEEAAEIENAARAALTEVRSAVGGWRQASLDAELEAARRALAAVEVELIVERNPDLEIVGSAEHALSLALREAITNVARHAGARRCRVDIETHGDELRLVVADDGVGGTARDGHGLTGMRERIAALGGRVHRVGTTGTTLTIAVPLQVVT